MTPQDYVLMLPYKQKGNYTVQSQYTAYYPDWHTLCCSSTGWSKEFPEADDSVFYGDLSNNLMIL